MSDKKVEKEFGLDEFYRKVGVWLLVLLLVVLVTLISAILILQNKILKNQEESFIEKNKTTYVYETNKVEGTESKELETEINEEAIEENQEVENNETTERVEQEV